MFRTVRPSDLVVDGTQTPLAATRTPTFSWRIRTHGHDSAQAPNPRGSAQTAYRILVARTADALERGDGDVWDSGRVESDQSTAVTYDGDPLSPDTTYHWTVRIRDEHGEPTPYGASSRFTTAPQALDGEWIAHQPAPGDTNGYRSRWRSADADVAEWVQVDLGEPVGLFNTASHYLTTAIVADAADELGRDADAHRYRDRVAEIADGFNHRFLDADAGEYRPGTQAAQAVPLYLDIVPESHESAVLDALVSRVEDAGDELRTGFLGTRPLLFALADGGHADLAYRVVTNPEPPGWGYMIRQGATTMWERWDSDQQVGSGMNSLNHSPFTLVSEWLFGVLAGIRPAMGGNHVTVAPAFVTDLDWAEGGIDTPNGRVRSRWERTDDGVALDITIPWNTTASVRLPVADAERIRERGDEHGEGNPLWTAADGTTTDGVTDDPPVAGVRSVERAGETATVEVTTGEYEFVVER